MSFLIVLVPPRYDVPTCKKGLAEVLGGYMTPLTKMTTCPMTAYTKKVWGEHYEVLKSDFQPGTLSEFPMSSSSGFASISKRLQVLKKNLGM